LGGRRCVPSSKIFHRSPFPKSEIALKKAAANLRQREAARAAEHGGSRDEPVRRQKGEYVASDKPEPAPQAVAGSAAWRAATSLSRSTGSARWAQTRFGRRGRVTRLRVAGEPTMSAISIGSGKARASRTRNAKCRGGRQRPERGACSAFRECRARVLTLATKADELVAVTMSVSGCAALDRAWRGTRPSSGVRWTRLRRRVRRQSQQRRQNNRARRRGPSSLAPGSRRSLSNLSL